jgi:hypothetical protein
MMTSQSRYIFNKMNLTLYLILYRTKVMYNLRDEEERENVIVFV